MYNSFDYYAFLITARSFFLLCIILLICRILGENQIESVLGWYVGSYLTNNSMCPVCWNLVFVLASSQWF